MPRPKRTRVTDTRPSARGKTSLRPPRPRTKATAEQSLASDDATQKQQAGGQERSLDLHAAQRSLERVGTMSFRSEAFGSSSPRAIPSAARANATPSFLQLSNFKRRPRQPSLLRMVRQQSGIDSPYDDDTNIEDSLLRNLEASSPAPLRRYTEPHVENRGALPGGGRKRKATDIHYDQSSVPPSSPPTGEFGVENVRDIGASIQKGHTTQAYNDAAHSASNSYMVRVRNLSGRSHTRSSVVVPTSPPEPAAKVLELKLVTPEAITLPPRRRRVGRILRDKHQFASHHSPSPPIDATSPSSSPCSTQAAPVSRKASTNIKVTHRRQTAKAETRSAAEKQKRVHPTTATLKALLPKRREGIPRLGDLDSIGIVDEFDLPSSSPQDVFVYEEDRRRRPTGKTNSQPLEAKDANAKLVGNAALRTKIASQQAKSRARPWKTRNAGGVKTYGRRVDEKNDENDVPPYSIDEDESAYGTGATMTTKSVEMAAASSKFQEVDGWKLDFESCDVGGESSSPWR